MKLFLTSEASAGKTTLLQKLSQVTQGAFWIITERTYDAAGTATGYRVTTSTKSVGNFANDVTPQVIDNLYSGPLKYAVEQGYRVIIVDEIGSRQLSSPAFVSTLEQALSSSATVLASLSQSETGDAQYTLRPGTVTLNLSEVNRDELTGALESCLSSQRMVASLPLDEQAAIERLAEKYAAGGQITPFRKLFQNTIIYLAEDRYQTSSIGSYVVRGLTRTHTVVITNGKWMCDCDLANGRGKFEGRAGECSHIQTIKVSQKLV
jgi:nucleoside-triphosphatase THEP1